jgi:hypothetical protein
MTGHLSGKPSEFRDLRPQHGPMRQHSGMLQEGHQVTEVPDEREVPDIGRT